MDKLWKAIVIGTGIVTSAYGLWLAITGIKDM